MAYNLGGLRTPIRAKIKDSSYPSATIDGFINDAIQEIAELYPCKILGKIVSGTLTVDEYTYEQQADHYSTKKLILADPLDNTLYTDITKAYMPSDEFFECFPMPDVQTSGRPYHWTEYGDQLYFDRPVDKAYLLRQHYQRLPADLVADEDIPVFGVNFREAIVLGASYRCEEERDNYDIAATLQNRFNDKTGDIINRNTNDTMTGPDTVVMPGRWRDE